MIADRLGQIFLWAFVIALGAVTLESVIPGRLTNPFDVAAHVVAVAAMAVLMSMCMIFFILLVIDIIVRRPRR
jgi:hypothetical protein